MVLVYFVFTFAGCRVEEKKSILILTFEHLNSQENLCNREKNNLRNSGFLEICPESIRFTHAYVPSTLSLPNLSTLMTGLYPYQHQVRHNGPPGLGAEYVTLAEIAVQNNFRTAFFSGGPPVFRKSGLNQGFELFDEKVKITPRTFHSPFADLIQAYREWIANEVRRDSFLATFYIPDLLFKDSLKTDLIEARSPGYENQLEEIDEGLFQLITMMKKNQIWNKTTVIILGLNGRPNPERGHVLHPLNLHSENTQVTLLIKPAYEESQSVHSHRTFDAPVSVADVGRTIFEILGQGLRKKNASETLFPVFSLKQNLESTSAPWPGQRVIPIESGWMFGHELGEIRSAAVLNHELILFDGSPKLYNTLTDRWESRPYVFNNYSEKPIASTLRKLSEAGYKPWRWPASVPQEIFRIPQELWWNPVNETKLLERINQITSATTPLNPLDLWGALFSLQKKQSKKLGKFIKRLHYPEWSSEFNPCYQLIDRKDANFTDKKKCSSKIFLLWLDWTKSEKKTGPDLMKTALFKALAQQEIQRRIQKINWGLNLIWNDYELSIPQINELDWVMSKTENTRDRALFSRSLENIEKQVYQDSDFISY